MSAISRVRGALTINSAPEHVESVDAFLKLFRDRPIVTNPLDDDSNDGILLHRQPVAFLTRAHPTVCQELAIGDGQREAIHGLVPLLTPSDGLQVAAVKVRHESMCHHPTVSKCHLISGYCSHLRQVPARPKCELARSVQIVVVLHDIAWYWRATLRDAHDIARLISIAPCNQDKRPIRTRFKRICRDCIRPIVRWRDGAAAARHEKSENNPHK